MQINEFLIIGNQNLNNKSLNKLGIKIKKKDKKNIISQNVFFQKKKNNKIKSLKKIIKKKSIFLIFFKLNDDLNNNIATIARHLELIRNSEIKNLVYLINIKIVNKNSKKTKLNKIIINEIIASYNIIYKLNILYKE